MGLFKKKPGGTLFGNLLRSVASSYTGGVLGSGANRLPLPSTSPVATVDTSPVSTVPTSPVQGVSIVSDVLGTLHGLNKTLNEGLEVKPASKTWLYVAGAGALAVVLWLLFRKKAVNT